MCGESLNKIYWWDIYENCYIIFIERKTGCLSLQYSENIERRIGKSLLKFYYTKKFERGFLK